MEKEISITTKTVLCSGDIHYFHFDNLRDSIDFISCFEELISSPKLKDDVEQTYIEFSDGINVVSMVL